MEADRTGVLEFVSSSHRPVIDTTSDYMRLLNANSYQKGSWILHMLRRELGDTVFHKSIRDYYAAYGGKNADSHDLQQIFENNAGKTLDGFFEQWLNRPVNPKLDISWKYLPGNTKLKSRLPNYRRVLLFHSRWNWDWIIKEKQPKSRRSVFPKNGNNQYRSRP